MLKLSHLAALLGCACLFPTPALTDDFELLANGGFEAGNLTGWIQTLGSGHVVGVSGPAALPCARISPNVPKTGSYLFSSSIQDGATPNTLEITISQTIDISGFTGVATGSASIVASGFFSGALGCNTSSSDDLAQIVIEFRTGGPNGAFVGSVSSLTLDPTVGSWNPLAVNSSVPSTADTVVVRVRTLLDQDFSSIDIGIDDMSLILTVPPVIPALNTYALGLLASILLGVAAFSRARTSA